MTDPRENRDTRDEPSDRSEEPGGPWAAGSSAAPNSPTEPLGARSPAAVSGGAGGSAGEQTPPISPGSSGPGGELGDNPAASTAPITAVNSADAPVTPATPTPRLGPRPPRPARHVTTPLPSKPLISNTGALPVVPPPTASAYHPSHRRMVSARVFGFVVVVVLIVLVAQTIGLVYVSDQAYGHDSDLTDAHQRISELEEQGRDLSSRMLRLEDKTSGALNSVAVAKEALKSVFRVSAGEEVGTAFAFGPRPKGGGTDLITNYHVIQDSVGHDGDTISVEHKDHQYNATVKKADEKLDLAVLHIATTFDRLQPSRAQVQSGDPVVVVGAPLGFSDSVTTGVVSGTDRRVEGLNTPLIQFDAAISPGNSGGPVVNANGEVVGVAQAKITASDADGLALAIPIKYACSGPMQC